MKKIYLFLLILPFFAFSQEKSFWSKTSASKIQQSQLLDRNSTPTKFDVYNLNFEGIKNELGNAVSRSSNLESDTYIKFPNAKGELERYQIYNASIMEAEFAEKHPDIQSYVGINIDNPGVSMRFSTTIFGFHASIYTIGKTYYIDPYTEDLGSYILYAKDNLYSDIDRLSCQLTDEMALNSPYQPDSNRLQNLRNANDGLFRTFRFALASTQEYSNFHINAAGQQAATDEVKRATVLAAMNVTMTRVNGIYERDLSASMMLIDNTNIIFLAENDGYTNNDGFAMLAQNQSIIDANIGTANYDVGHVFSTGGGGVASLGGICFSNTKARAVTGLNSPIGDVFDVDFVAHEVGHHFGANHSYNGGDGNCGGQRNQGTAVEVGSGNTIMGYAGICASDNVQPNSDDHFHAVSIDEMYARITSSPTCSVNTPNGNTAPTADAGDDYTIPFGTAFTLTGTGTDIDSGASLSYNWEQVDTGTTTDQPNTTSTTNPQFRSRPSLSTGERTFPQLSDILDDNLTPQWEVIPNVARTMNFALTVRDNQSPNGGQTNRDDMIVTTANVGPFQITSQSTPVVFMENSSTTVEWDVAGTTANGINTSQVNILLSTDGGLNFNTTLAANTANDGTESVTFPPGVTSGDCRIKIEAVGNIYFAINKSFFAIGNYTIVNNESCQDYIFNVNQTIPVSSTTYTGFALTINDSETITDVDVSVNITHPNNGEVFTAIISPEQASGFQELSNGSCNGTANTDFTYDDEAGTINCVDFNSGGSGQPAETLSIYDGQNSNGQWVFLITDVSDNANTGTLDTVTITICSGTVEAVLGDNDFELNDFALFPNPNNGDFTIQFNSNSGIGVNVDVYDISGKLVFNKNYDPTSRFDKQINLNNVSTGIYIMKVNDGDKSVTRKLIIK
ncbi:reprolysin-like metallopeptidase [Winogradskyella jejuensis]|uniref:Por secretion system C-terminal sorting domain-containing protein n=1 Tax=Winogradskyella jejuensis TaxID=1089305 RepID=A0A1M5TPU1_9FLAO|nr:zinc-dependent metalloprotease family protein [Winogradskyella jejuensis]SHH52787.1 Por secretion system C-terminal sorting domain-containing protein [Winogradskyella jejuensis]